MNADLVKELFDACFLAKRITQMLPVLPVGMVPRHVHIMDALCRLERKRGTVHVGDVSALMKSTTPSVTKLLGELEDLGYVVKKAVSGDRRRVAVSLTKKGRLFHSRYVAAYHGMLADALSDLGDDECRAVVKVMTVMHDRIRVVTDAFVNRDR